MDVLPFLSIFHPTSSPSHSPPHKTSKNKKEEVSSGFLSSPPTLLPSHKQEVGLLKKFKLATTISTSNMMLFDPQGQIKKYDTPEDILREFFDLRLEYYTKRRWGEKSVRFVPYVS